MLLQKFSTQSHILVEQPSTLYWPQWKDPGSQACWGSAQTVGHGTWALGNPSLLIGQVTLLNPGLIYSLAVSLACSLRSMGPTHTSKPSPPLFTLLLPLLSSPLLIFHFYHSRLRLDLLYLCFSNYSIDTMQVIAWLKINSIKLKIDPTNCRNYLKLGLNQNIWADEYVSEFAALTKVIRMNISRSSSWSTHS